MGSNFSGKDHATTHRTLSFVQLIIKDIESGNQVQGDTLYPIVINVPNLWEKYLHVKNNPDSKHLK